MGTPQENGQLKHSVASTQMQACQQCLTARRPWAGLPWEADAWRTVEPEGHSKQKEQHLQRHGGSPVFPGTRRNLVWPWGERGGSEVVGASYEEPWWGMGF